MIFNDLITNLQRDSLTESQQTWQWVYAGCFLILPILNSFCNAFHVC